MLKYFVMIAVLFFGLFLFSFSALAQTPGIVISEVGFKEVDDFVELTVLVDGDYDGYLVQEGGVVIAEVDAGFMEVGDIIVLHEKSGENEWIGSVYHMYGAGSLRGTDNVISLLDSDGVYIDGVIWSNDNGSFTGSSSVANGLVELGIWEADTVFSRSDDSAAWMDSDEVESGMSLHRNELEFPLSALSFDLGVHSIGVSNLYAQDEIEYSLRISELLPNPTGSDLGSEFIELYNFGDSSYDLAHCYVLVNDKRYIFSDEVILPDSYYVHTFGGSALRNSSAEVALLCDDAVVSDVIYANAPEGQSLNYGLHAYEWSIVTSPGGNNVIESFLDEDTEVSEDLVELDAVLSVQEDDEGVLSSPPTIRMSEIFPNAPGSDAGKEWIELYNYGHETIQLDSLVLDDGELGNGAFLAGEVAAHSFIVLESPVSLNNGSETLRLLFEDVVLDEVSYQDAPEGVSYVFDGETWQWSTTVTQGFENIVNVVVEEEPSEVQQDAASFDDDSVANENEATSDCVANPEGIVELSEVFPNPEGSDAGNEWIEVRNTSDFVVNLCGLEISDGGSQKFTVSERVGLAAGDYYVISDFPFALNNSNEVLTLRFGSYEQRIEYKKSIEGASYGFFDGEWRWTTLITPGAVNAYTSPPSQSEKGSTSKAKRSTSSGRKLASEGYKNVSVAEIYALEKGDLVSFSGIVTVSPGMLWKRSLYVQDGDRGIEVYKSKGDLPRVSVGDSVQLRGKVSHTKDGVRVLLAEIEDLVVVESGKGFDIIDVVSDGLGASMVSRIVRITGILQKVEGNVLFIEDDTGVIRVVINRASEISAKDFATGVRYRIQGLLQFKEGEYRVVPRSKDDIELLDEAHLTNTDAITLDDTPSSPLFDNLWLFLIVGGVGIGVVLYLFKEQLARYYEQTKKEKHSKSQKKANS